MTSPAEDVTRTWVKKKGFLLKHKPAPSRFSLVVCLSIVFALGFGFLSGFFVAGFALNDNYSSVYASLLTELEDTRACIDREKAQLMGKKEDKQIPAANLGMAELVQANHQVHEQTIFSVFSHAVELLQKNDKKGACKELNNIVKLGVYEGEWRTKSLYLMNKNCQ